MNSKREVVIAVIREYLEEVVSENAVHEAACEIADEIFQVLGIPPEEQAKPVIELMPYRLPRINIKGKSYFIDMRLKQLRNVNNPNEFLNFEEDNL